MKNRMRKKKLILGSFQLQLILQFVGIAALALGLQFLYLVSRLVYLSQGAFLSREEILDSLPRLFVEVFVLSAVILLPLFFFVAILLTFPVAGPLFRLERHLRSIAAGDVMPDFNVRDGDRHGEIAEALNAAVRTLRRGDRAEPEDEGQEPLAQSA